MFNEAHVEPGRLRGQRAQYSLGRREPDPEADDAGGLDHPPQGSATGEWVDGNTSFVTVICWRKLAENLATCLRKGDPVLVRGRLDVRSFTGKDGQRSGPPSTWTRTRSAMT